MLRADFVSDTGWDHSMSSGATRHPGPGQRRDPERCAPRASRVRAPDKARRAPAGRAVRDRRGRYAVVRSKSGRIGGRVLHSHHRAELALAVRTHVETRAQEAAGCRATGHYRPAACTNGVTRRNCRTGGSGVPRERPGQPAVRRSRGGFRLDPGTGTPAGALRQSSSGSMPRFLNAASTNSTNHLIREVDHQRLEERSEPMASASAP